MNWLHCIRDSGYALFQGSSWDILVQRCLQKSRAKCEVNSNEGSLRFIWKGLVMRDKSSLVSGPVPPRSEYYSLEILKLINCH